MPAGVIDAGALGGDAGAEARREGAIAAFANAFDVQYSGLLADEFTDYFLQGYTFSASTYFVDARNSDASNTEGGTVGSYQFTDPIYTRLQQARINAELAKAALAQSATARSQGTVGEMFALAGYTEVLLAEEFCSGVPVGEVLAGGGEQHGTPLTTDSLLGRAVADFDSALATGAGSDTALNLARVGLGRALLDRGHYAAAAAAVTAVPIGFTYAVFFPALPQGTIQGDFYALQALPVESGGHFWSVSDHEGGTGLDFVSAGDPRMPVDSTLGPSPTGTPFYYPAKFPIGGAPPITLANWVEARLIQAEGALQVGDTPGWLTTLNALRADSADTHMGGLAPLADPGTLAAQVDLTFRERAFWMFGTGHRLGDLRRLIRQYGRGPNTVFPTGPYPAGPISSLIATYGTDVTFPIAAVESANSNFHGCLNRRA